MHRLFHKGYKIN